MVKCEERWIIKTLNEALTEDKCTEVLKLSSRSLSETIKSLVQFTDMMVSLCSLQIS